MPSIETLLFSQCHQVRGPYSGAGSVKPASRSLRLYCFTGVRETFSADLAGLAKLDGWVSAVMINAKEHAGSDIDLCKFIY
mgnify:CR=1 FL=1